MKTDLFDYPLPDRLIAQKPADRRDESRLLVVERKTRVVEHRHFRDLPDYLRAGDCLFRNNAAVIPARLRAQRLSGGHVECLLLRPAWSAGNLARDLSSDLSAIARGATAEALAKDDADSSAAGSPRLQGKPSAAHTNEWWCLLRPGKKLSAGATFGLEGIFTATVREKTGDGLVRVAFETKEGDILAIANRIGEMPLPPYIKRPLSCRSLLASDGCPPDAAADSSPASRLLQAEAQRVLDRERYQTVYAHRGHQVAVAAPTAGLHFTPELLARLAAQSIAFADLTLHVGLGTFRSITTGNVEDHAIHREVYEISAATQRALFGIKGRRVAVGTTSVRTIEDFMEMSHRSNRLAGLSAEASCPPRPWRRRMAEADIFIYPPRDFRGVDALITNFHQPRSTLLCLVAAFLTPGSTDGIAWLKEIYAEAVAREYRFFSYGDAMLIL